MLPATLPTRYGFDIEETVTTLSFRPLPKAPKQLWGYFLLGLMLPLVAVNIFVFDSLTMGLIPLFMLSPAIFYLFRRGPGNSLDFVPFTIDKSTNEVERNGRYLPFDDGSHFAYFAEKEHDLHVGGLVLIDGEIQNTLLELDSTNANFLKDDLVLLVTYCNDWLSAVERDSSAN